MSRNWIMQTTEKWSRIKNKLIHFLCALQNVHETQYFSFGRLTESEKVIS